MLSFIFLYPYTYQTKNFLFTVLFVTITAGVAYFLYLVITSFMGKRIKRIFHLFLKIFGIVIMVGFFIEITFSLITIHHVNKQLGFSYATPDTPEGELFEIRKVVPGKTMDQAGLQTFDHVQMHSVNDLYRLLIYNQFEVVKIPVKRDGQFLEIRVEVPELQVPFKKISFLF